MTMLGFTVNLMTLFALILAIGIVVDDAIVIVENSSYYVERGLSPKEATIKAMGEMTGPVIGITLVLTAVFLPAAFFPGITGQLFRQFALVIASTAVISAINALTLKPAQCALWLRPRQEQETQLVLPGLQSGLRDDGKGLRQAGRADGASHRPSWRGVRGHDCADGMALRTASHRISARRRPGVCHRRGAAAGWPRRSPESARWRKGQRHHEKYSRHSRLGDHRRLFHPGCRQS